MCSLASFIITQDDFPLVSLPCGTSFRYFLAAHANPPRLKKYSSRRTEKGSVLESYLNDLILSCLKSPVCSFSSFITSTPVPSFPIHQYKSNT